MLNAIMIYSLVWGGQGAIAYRSLKDRSRSLENNIAFLDESNLSLGKEINLLRSDKKYQEKIIRTRLNYVKKNEILYVFPPSNAEAGESRDDGKN